MRWSWRLWWSRRTDDGNHMISIDRSPKPKPKRTVAKKYAYVSNVESERAMLTTVTVTSDSGMVLYGRVRVPYRRRDVFKYIQSINAPCGITIYAIAKSGLK